MEVVSAPRSPIPLIDLFAGPGGLGEGFSSVTTSSGKRAFDIRLSVEKDPAAHETLLLRSFFRQFRVGSVPDEYYAYVRGEIKRDDLFLLYPAEAEKAKQEAWCAELGKEDHEVVRKRIERALGAEADSDWVLIGGPPCQAYSLAGRARILGAHRKRQEAEVEKGERERAEVDPESAFDHDHRHLLYREYLRIIADHQPAVFVMENVPGILSSKVNGKPVIQRILRDLRYPVRALNPEERPASLRGGKFGDDLEYQIVTLKAGSLFDDGRPSDLRDFVLDASQYGVPQARRRVLIVGVRSDHEFQGWPRRLGLVDPPVTVREAIGDLPRLRSTLSRQEDSASRRAAIISGVKSQKWFTLLDKKVQAAMASAVRRIENGSRCLPSHSDAAPLPVDDGSAFMKWCRDARLQCTANHHARSHMASDLHRYLFVSSFGEVNKVSPRLRHFPEELLPNHASAKSGAKGKSFADRFRVQLSEGPSTTIVSHMSRDGHYYIHYDPSQCRSLTVREAARLQSFPDNYLFEGNRTAQYTQVGNAVPPLLAHEIAKTVLSFLSESADDTRELGGSSLAVSAVETTYGD